MGEQLHKQSHGNSDEEKLGFNRQKPQNRTQFRGGGPSDVSGRVERGKTKRKREKMFKMFAVVQSLRPKFKFYLIFMHREAMYYAINVVL